MNLRHERAPRAVHRARRDVVREGSLSRGAAPAKHGRLHQISRASLNDAVHRLALRLGAFAERAGVNLRQSSMSARHRKRDGGRALRVGQDSRYPLFHVGKRAVKRRDVTLRFTLGDTQFFGETGGLLSVHDGVRRRFGAISGFSRDGRVER